MLGMSMGSNQLRQSNISNLGSSKGFRKTANDRSPEREETPFDVASNAE
jgi:hypothetical protein